MPDRFIAGLTEVGVSCPYCRFALKQGILVTRCSACSAVHHAECWDENGGCAVVACSNGPLATGHLPPPLPAPPVRTKVDAQPAQGASPSSPPTREPDGHGRRVAAIVIGLAVIAAAIGAALVLLLGHGSPSHPAAGLPSRTVTVQVTTSRPTRANTTPRPASRGVGVPATYFGRFTAVDRLERCNATAGYVYCTAGPSGRAAKLTAGVGAADLGVRGSKDLGGPSLPEGTSFVTPNGRFRCGSSTRGITCQDLASGAQFVIGDYKLVIQNPPASAPTAARVPARYAGLFTSVDRRERCVASDGEADCSSGPSGQAVKLVVGGGATYEGLLGSSDGGGAAMPEGTSFRTPAGTIECGSSTRGITCTDLASGDGFVIGDHYVDVSNGGHVVRH